ncbi:flagellar biosynthesis protein FlhF [Bacillaceae bacterium S4-13-58]
MKVKKFVAPTMPEAMKKIRKELGEEAVILNSKVVTTGGIMGMFRKKNIEVIAAIDPKPKQEKPVEPVLLSKERVLPNESIKTNPDKTVDLSNEVLKEIQELKELLNKKSLSKGTHYPPTLQTIYEHLIDQEMDESVAQKLVTTIFEKDYIASPNATKETAMSWLKNELKMRMSSLDFGGVYFDTKYIHLVGPTGVGKTTTLAKIAAESVIKHNKKVAFITTDTYRIAAIDQLKTYAKILDVPLEVAYNLEDFKKAKEKFEHYDLILVDTAGRNYRNPKYVTELNKVIEFDEKSEIYLVLSLTSKARDMNEIFEQFSSVPIEKFIFTKVDETSRYGTMASMILEHRIGVAYLTNGQNVPDDIKAASYESIISTIVGEN